MAETPDVVAELVELREYVEYLRDILTDATPTYCMSQDDWRIIVRPFARRTHAIPPTVERDRT